MKKNEKCVHTEHCCIEHGCKYNDVDCPVWLGYKCQSYNCEDCEPGNQEMPSPATIEYRRQLALDYYPDFD
jgi:hypothetical protein